MGSSAGALSEERREQLEDIDPSWCPTWPVEWQRTFTDLGRWVKSVRLGWDKLTGVQQWMCEHILHITPAADDEKPRPRVSQADKWALNYAAAKQYYRREGHLRVPRKHVEEVAVGGVGGRGGGADREEGGFGS
ncbi:helicase associated domain-containing protein [Streptomyces sp. 5K101]|uniref:helicase associated domain-containing protein n=1 Tax=Streptomyces sp. 5K101 TaxID=3390037 RepID=UPI003976F125